MLEVFQAIRKVSQSRCSVLIRGETGTGKELVARSLHEMGPDRNKPFVTVDCGGIAPTLIESEFFGHVRGAFTGAVASKQGLLEAANGGTLFFDEVAELPISLQTRLLRASQEKEFRPLGSTKQTRFEARILSATNQDLEASVAQGSFRRDLFFRLNVVSLLLPPLRERREDIPVLAEEILGRRSFFSDRSRGTGPLTVSEEALACLLSYDWPGNVRELENCLLRALILGENSTIRVEDLPVEMQCPSSRKALHDPRNIRSLEAIKHRAILEALTETDGDKQGAARLLGIGKSTVYRKLKEYSQSPGKIPADGSARWD